ncbi:MAG: helix-turn-helix domain-containing protein [Alphaproteobacteria bacterium]|nr:helix-turn-helix domain-containing protein [Alphaproteobacteria bacterium]MCD8570545.1 helix-turn-helix domain-containing protein [Alphaproteobacteria bacterium]
MTTKRKTKGTPDNVDVHVGQRLRIRRSLLGMSQEKLAEAIGLTFQQIQKYERGTNRVSAGRLYQFSKILGVPIAYFYEQFGEPFNQKEVAQTGLSDQDQDGFEGPGSDQEPDLMKRRETIDLVRSYYSIQDPKIRKDMLKLMKSMAQTSS